MKTYFLKIFVCMLAVAHTGFICAETDHTGNSSASDQATASRVATPLSPEEWSEVRGKLLRRAEKSGISKSSNFQKVLKVQTANLLTDFYTRDYLSKHPIPEEAIAALYEKRKPSWMVKEYQARHILAQTPEKLKIVQELLSKGVAFEKVAYDESDDPMTGGNGGQTGWFQDIPQVPEILKAVQRMTPNQVSEPIKSNAGFHIIKLLEVRDAAIPSLEEKRKDLYKELAMEKLKKLVEVNHSVADKVKE
jgi:peptidyl-prolyl cis-trans isomerase C